MLTLAGSGLRPETADICFDESELAGATADDRGRFAGIELQVPAAAGYVRGRRVSAFPPLAPDIAAAGGEFVEGKDVVDGNMVSATGWPDLAEWSRAFMEILERAAVPA